MIYKCIKEYNDITVGSLWENKPNHYMFKEMGGSRYRYLPPHILERFFQEVKTL